MSLRILHTESSWGWGGQELRILTESAALAERGHQLCIAAPPDTPILRRAAQMGIEAVALPIKKKALRGILATRRFLEGRRFDVVNTHSSTDSWLVALALLTLRERPALVRTRHVSTAVRPGWANRWLYGKATQRLVCTGEVVRRALTEQLALPGSHVISIPTGVSSEAYRPADAGEKTALRRTLGLPIELTLIGCVATLRMLKGIDHLFQAMQDLRTRSIHLVIVGDGPQMERLQSLRRELGLEALVTMAGEQHNVEDWLKAMDMFAFPSLAEGVPQALAQAMLTGLPCVTTNVGGIPELATHRQTAWVCPPRDAKALSEGIEALLEDSKLAAQLGLAAREHCIENISIQKMAESMERVFEEAVLNCSHAAGIKSNP